MANDTELTGSFIWSKTRKNLSELLKEYQLPQIVRVVDGFCGKNEETSINNEQILAFHKICSVRKLLGTDSSGKQVIIPLTCPTQVLVCPSKCKYTPCKVEDFKSIFPKVQYVRVKSCGPQSRNASDILQRSLKVGDILQIQKIDKKKKSVVCQNTDTKGGVTLSYTSPAIFTPLLDSRKYTLSEVVINYGLHSRVCFETTRSQADQNSDQWSSALTGLTEVVFHKVLTEVKVIATTVGGVGEVKHCMGLPTDLPIHCAVAKRFTKNGRSYEDVVRSLHAGFNSKNLSERVNVFQDINAVKLYDLSESMATVPRPQPENSLSPVRSNAPRSPPPVSPKPKKRIMSDLPEPPKDSKYALGDPKQPTQSPPEDSTTTAELCDKFSRSRPENSSTTGKVHVYEKLSRSCPDISTNTDKVHVYEKLSRSSPEISTTTDKVNVYDKLSRSPPEDSATTTEDDYIEMGIVEKNMHENTDLEKKKNTADNQDDFNSALKQCSINQASFNQPEINSRYSNIYEEVIPPWNSNFKQEFADPNLFLNEQLSEVHSGYVIPMISPNLQPQTKKFEAHKRTDAKNKSSDSHENVECKMDKYVYEDMDPKFEWDSDSRKFERSENCKSHEDIIPQTASNVKFEKTSETKFETQPYAVTQVR